MTTVFVIRGLGHEHLIGSEFESRLRAVLPAVLAGAEIVAPHWESALLTHADPLTLAIRHLARTPEAFQAFQAWTRFVSGKE